LTKIILTKIIIAADSVLQQLGTIEKSVDSCGILKNETEI
jgi:hypothetical protein